jgi:hypothetical protein
MFRPFIAGAIAVIAAAAALVTASSAQAFVPPDLQRTIDTSVHNDDPFKSATADCPPGKRLVGGGGGFNNAITGDVRFVALAPSDTRGTGFTASAEKAGYVRGYDWSVRAYAICAPALIEYKIDSVSALGSGPFRTASAACSRRGTVAYGSGASVAGASGRVGLQTNRTSSRLDRAYAAAREDIVGNPNPNWSVSSYAICAKPQDGIHSVSALRSGTIKTEIACPPGQYVHGPGGGVPLVDNGWTFIGDLVPVRDLKSSLLAMSTVATGGVINPHITCAGGS